MALFGSKIEIGDDTILCRKSDMLFNMIEGEIVMLSIENNKYYGLDLIGSHIWMLLDNPKRFKELISKLVDEYEVPKEQCKQDSLEFLTKMVENKLVVLG